MPNDIKIIHLGPGEGDAFSAVGDVYRVLASGQQTGDVYSLSEIRVSPNNGPPPHIHSHEDESFFVLEGEIEFQVGDEKITARPGTFIQGREALHTVLGTTRDCPRACWALLPRQDLRISSTNLRDQSRHSIRRRYRLAKTKSIDYWRRRRNTAFRFCRRTHENPSASGGFVIGKRDMEGNVVSVRVHGKGNLGAKPRGEAIAEILLSLKERRA